MAELRGSGYALASRQEMASILLEDDLPTARERAAQAELQRQNDPIWGLLRAALQTLAGEPIEMSEYFGPDAALETEHFLRGPNDAAHDVRRMIGVLLAQEDPVLHLWAHGELARLPSADYGRLWPMFLPLPLRPSLARAAPTQETLEVLTQLYPEFGPAWDRLDRLIVARSDSPDSEEHAALRARRRKALGDQALHAANVELDQARQAARAGRTRKAVVHALAAQEADPESVEVHWLLGRLYTASGSHERAIESYQLALEHIQPAPDLPLTHDALSAFLTAFQRGGIDADECAKALASVATRLPDDPAVPLERARLELLLDARNPALAVARAYAHIDRFRDMHPETSIDSLRMGSAAACARFLIALDPAL